MGAGNGPIIANHNLNKVKGLNALDANLDLVPFDSISNPGRSVRENNHPITRLASNNRRIVAAGGNARPEIDSFYNDRNDVRAK